jgi:hypothetical protein
VVLLAAIAPFLAMVVSAAIVFAILSTELVDLSGLNLGFRLLQVSFFMVFIYSADGLLLFLLLPVRSKSNPLSRLWNRVVRAGRASRRKLKENGTATLTDPSVGAPSIWRSRTAVGVAACLLLAQLVLIVANYGVPGP